MTVCYFTTSGNCLYVAGKIGGTLLSIPQLMLSHKLYSNNGRASGYVRQADIDEARYPELIVSLAKNNEFISNADIVQLLHVSNSQAYRLLKCLVDEGRLESVNKGRYAKYRIKQ